MAPYRAIPRDYLSDTPILRAMGFSVSQHGQLGAMPPPPFLSVSPLESMRCGGAMPTPAKEYLSDTGAIPHEIKAHGCNTPLCHTEKVLRDMGGISHWAAHAYDDTVLFGELFLAIITGKFHSIAFLVELIIVM